MYSRAKIPFMTDRENLIHFGVTKGEGTCHFLIKSIEHPDYPEKKGVIRMDVFKSSKITQVGNDIHLMEFSNFDMKGYFPTRLINMMMAASVQKGMSRFYGKIVEMEKAKNGQK